LIQNLVCTYTNEKHNSNYSFHYSKYECSNTKDRELAYTKLYCHNNYGMSSVLYHPEVQIIGFGEASHGHGSFFKHKINSFKWLV